MEWSHAAAQSSPLPPRPIRIACNLRVVVAAAPRYWPRWAVSVIHSLAAQPAFRRLDCLAAIAGGVARHRAETGLLLGWVAGTVCFAAGSYWLAAFIVNLKQISPALSLLLAGLFWCYSRVCHWPGVMLYRWLTCRLEGWELLVFPLCVVAVMALYPMLFKTHFADGQVASCRRYRPSS